MAKPLSFLFEGNKIDFQMIKVDRSKLYGYKEPEVLDENGDKCELATLAEDGRTVIGRGGTGIGYMTADGLWTDKNSLVPVDLEGEKMYPIPSSFSAPIDLSEKITIDEFLNHNIRLVYKLDAEQVNATLDSKLKCGVIFKFGYSFRGGLESDAGFLLNGEYGDTFFLVGDETAIDFVGLKQVATLPDEDMDDDSDELDFDMI